MSIVWSYKGAKLSINPKSFSHFWFLPSVQSITCTCKPFKPECPSEKKYNCSPQIPILPLLHLLSELL